MMDLFERVLVAVDDSESSTQTTIVAARLVREHAGALVICHAVNWVPVIAQMASAGAIGQLDGIADEMKARGGELVERYVGIAVRAGSPATGIPLDGEASTAIVELAERERCSLIVMGTHDRSIGERLRVGSVTHAVLRASTIPVLTVRPGRPLLAEGRRTFTRLVVGIDGSEPSEAVLETVFALPPEDCRELVFYCIAGESAFEYEQAEMTIAKALALADAHGLPAKGLVVAGRPDAMLVAAAQQRDADLIVVGSHGRSGIKRLILGSVAESIVRTSPVPVLVVRAHAAMTATRATSTQRAGAMA